MNDVDRMALDSAAGPMGRRPAEAGARGSAAPPRVGLLERITTAVDARVTRPRALLTALSLVVVAGLGDAVTTAEASFTLFYVVPLAIAVWFVGLPAGYVVAGLATTIGVLVDVFANPSPASVYFITWNGVAEALLYVSFAHVLAALRTRVDREVKMRVEALDQLRHAERLTTVGKLASGVAHEIGTPLNVISGHAELIASGELDAIELQRSARAIRSQVSRVTGIVRQLLDFSRRAGATPSSANLAQLAAETVELLRPVADRAGVKIVSRDLTQVQARVNASEIQQVLTNLITNAIQAMPEGGMLEIRTDRATTRPPSNREAPRPYAELSVRDHGQGIPPDILPHIFDPFFTTKDVGQGTGLGLSVSYGIVRDHGGFITVDTSLGHGTTFHVFLPQ